MSTSRTDLGQASRLPGSHLLGLGHFEAWRPRVIALLIFTGGAGIYLCAMDVLYDLQHGIYSNGHGGAIELAINILTAMLSIGLLASAWDFRHELLTPINSPVPNDL